MTPEEEITRAEEAARITGSALWVESIAKLKQEVIDKWAACPARDTDGREWLWQHYQVALKFEELFTEVLNSGKLARQMVKERTIGDKVQNFFGGVRR